MNKKLVPVIVVLVILALGSYYLKTRSSTTPPTNQTTSQAMNEASEFAKAIESGRPTVCTMAKGDDKMEYQIKGKMMRMQTTTTMKDESGVSKTTVGHMINDTKYLYIWDDKTKQGSKMTIPTDLPAEASTKPLAKEGEEIKIAPKFDNQADYESLKNEGYTITCKAGSVEDSVFTAPSDVKFIDPTEMMKVIPSPDTAGNIDLSKIEELTKQYGGQ